MYLLTNKIQHPVDCSLNVGGSHQEALLGVGSEARPSWAVVSDAHYAALAALDDADKRKVFADFAVNLGALGPDGRPTVTWEAAFFAAVGYPWSQRHDWGG
ncbi:MAG TPA: hypothetical protein VG963_16275 [Polyangiaceae bacterium]|nr:hypothetical protein [Polyangiaceae bacterium]